MKYMNKVTDMSLDMMPAADIYGLTAKKRLSPIM